MNLSTAGANFTKKSEGLALTPYANPSVTVGGFSIGYGHYYPPSIPLSQVPASITQFQANAFFDSDVSTAVSAVIGGLTVSVSQQTFDGLVDYTYNKGAGGMRASGVLGAINSGNLAAAANIIAGDIPKCGFKGLTPRRQHEAALVNNQVTLSGATYSFA